MHTVLRWGWVFLERTQILSGIQFTTHFIEFFVVETKRFVGSFGNVILTRQTCGQRSSRAAECKRRALGERKRRALGCAMAISGKKKCFDAGKIGFCHCAAVLQTQVPKMRTDLDLSHFYILTLGTHSKFARENNFLRSAFAFCSPARALAAGLPRQDHVSKTTDESFRFHNKKFDEMRCELYSTENLRSLEKYPTTS